MAAHRLVIIVCVDAQDDVWRDILSENAPECLRFYCIQKAFFVRSRTLRSGSCPIISQIGASGNYLDIVFPRMTFLCEHTAFSRVFGRPRHAARALGDMSGDELV
jgi:hypothetical protein